MIDLTTKRVETYILVNQFKEYAAANKGKEHFNPLKIYCGLTGRCIGDLNDDALYMLLATIPAETPMSLIYEQVCDMNLISAKSSPAWVYQTTESLKVLIKEDPTGACVFYLTRAYQQGNKGLMHIKQAHRWNSTKDHMEWNRVRIEIFHDFASKYAQKTLQATAELMLEVDAKVGLANCAMPSDSLYTILDARTLGSLIKHYKKILKKYEKQEIQYQPEGHTQSRLVYKNYKGIRRKQTKVEATSELKKAKYSEMNDIFNEVMHLNTREEVMQAREGGFVASKELKTDMQAVVKKSHTPVLQKATKGFSFKIKPKVSYIGHPDQLPPIKGLGK